MIALPLGFSATAFGNTALEKTDPQTLELSAPVSAGLIQLLRAAQQPQQPDEFLATAVTRLAKTLGVMGAAWIVSQEGRWQIVAETAPGVAPPAELVGEAADRRQVQSANGCVVGLATPVQVAPEALAFRLRPGQSSAEPAAMLARMAPVMYEALAQVRRSAGDRRRMTQLETVLDLARQWYRGREVEELLEHMAEAATRLLGCDRASIFLWDRPNHLLVGRPALGVPGGELRIPDNRGVVGQVIQSGQPRRVDAAVEPSEIDRQVDAQLGYRTRTLLCVPLRGASGELFGAFELINKQNGAFTPDDETALTEVGGLAAMALESAQDRQQLLAANRRIAQEAADRVKLIGQSPAIEALRSIIRRLADTDLAVLILGENGTGKEVIAQAVHYWSGRRDRPFVAVNCAAIPESLAESELFGHEKGAFTDARETRQGKFELAAGGTLFLDEIGDLSLPCQAKLLRVLEEKVLVRVGGSTPIHTDARVIAATNQNLAEMVRQKRFREDLYFRLNVVTLELPPLRDRPQDILLLAQHFLHEFCAKARRAVPVFSAVAERRLQTHLWPGNVRELRNLMERLAYLTRQDRIEVDDLAFILSPRADQTPAASYYDLPLGDATERFQVELIRRAIKQTAGNMSAAAERLGLHRSNLYRKMRQLGMDVPS